MSNLLYFKNSLNNKKKLLNEVFFKKSFIRSSLVLQRLSLMDNYSNFSILNSQKNKSSFCVTGGAINSSSKAFVNYLNKEINFTLTTCLFANETKYLIKDLHFVFSTNETKKWFNRLLFLKVIRGGFRCYYFGVVGFLPRKHANKLFLNFIGLVVHSLQKHQATAQEILGLLSLFKTNLTGLNPYCFQSSGIFISQIMLFPQVKKKVFSSGSTKIKRGVTGLNAVFVTKSKKTEIKT